MAFLCFCASLNPQSEAGKCGLAQGFLPPMTVALRRRKNCLDFSEEVSYVLQAPTKKLAEKDRQVRS